MGILKRFFLVLFIIICCLSPVAAAELIPGGQVIGLRLEDGAVYIAGFDPELGNSAQQAGLKSGDRILSADGKSVETSEDLREALTKSNGTLELTVIRNGKNKTFRLTPIVTSDGPKLGIYLRQGISGLGTVTFYHPDGSFGALGHGVMDGNTPISFQKGTVCGVTLLSIRRGKAGQPGQLLGALRDETSLGCATKNTTQGIFGQVSPPQAEVLSTGEAQSGEAAIRATVDEEGLQEYSVQIVKIYPNSNDRSRNMLIKITDPALLKKTGGIVQGMSGSPIIQNGKLVGAVTHVLVNDPTMGYGISIENMLDAAA